MTQIVVHLEHQRYQKPHRLTGNGDRISLTHHKMLETALVLSFVSRQKKEQKATKK